MKSSCKRDLGAVQDLRSFSARKHLLDPKRSFRPKRHDCSCAVLNQTKAQPSLLGRRDADPPLVERKEKSELGSSPAIHSVLWKDFFSDGVTEPSL